MYTSGDTSWFYGFVDNLNEKGLNDLQDAIDRRRKLEAEPVVRELAMFAGQDPLDGCLQKVERSKAIKAYRDRKGATLRQAQSAFAQFFADNKNRIPGEALKRLANSAKYLREAIYG